MKKNTIFKATLTGAGLVLSLFLALGGAAIETNYGIRTPGTIASDALVPARPFPHEFEAVGEGLRVQTLVDWIFWFAVLCALYWLFRKLGQKFAKPG